MPRLHTRLVRAACAIICTLAALASSPTTRAQTNLPPARLYSFGDAEITQAWLPRRDPSRVMPYRVEGVIAVPDGAGPFPVVFIFHAAQGGCPVDTSTPTAPKEQWPCAAAQEQRNDVGMAYLASALAARGYAAVVPNLNVVYANAFGAFGPEMRRYPDVLEAHLAGLLRANAEDTGALDVSLKGKLDLARIGMIGHGHGGLLAMQSARARAERKRSNDAPGNGPLTGVILVAPLYSLEGDADVPLAVVLPSCDGIAPDLNGQGYYEDARLNKRRAHLATSVYWIGANHNFFNEIARADDANNQSLAAGCDRALAQRARAQQRTALAQFAPDFFAAAAGNADAAIRAGLDAIETPPAELYGILAQTSLALPSAQRSIVVQPRIRDDLGYNGFGGYATTSGPADAEFCEYRTPCGRWPYVPGNPSMARFAWTTPLSALWDMPLGDAGVDLSQLSTLSFRAAYDPADYLNAHRKRQAMRITLTDVNDRTAAVMLDEATPALAYPPGGPELRGWAWAGHAFLGSVRVPMAEFRGIDLLRVKSLSFSPAGDYSGSLLIADVEFLGPAAQ